jgi:hypothetical protein
MTAAVTFWLTLSMRRHGQVSTRVDQLIWQPGKAQGGGYAWRLLYLAAVQTGRATRGLVSTIR